MGAWSELDTEVNITVDVSELEDAKNLPETDTYGVLDPWIELMDTNIKATIEGSKRGAEEVAKKNVKFQELFILQNCNNPSGMLATSIDYEQIDDYSYLIGTSINHIYPMSLEYGRKEIVPIDAKALAFYSDSGELIFRKRVGPAEPRPFVAPAYDSTSAIAKELVLAEIYVDWEEW